MTKLNSLALLGGALMVAGVGCFVFMFHEGVAAVAFTIGAVLFGIAQVLRSSALDSDTASNALTVRRLRSIQLVGCVLFVVAGVLMIDHTTHFLRPLFATHIDYVTYIYNKWLPAMLIAVVLELYTVHRLDKELKKQYEKDIPNND